MIRHVLFDADGVLQELEGGWVAALSPWVGEQAEDFIKEAVELEGPCLIGDGEFATALAGMVERRQRDVDADELYRAVWHRIEVDDRSLDLVRRVRLRGFGVHLATTQEAGRAAVMKRVYDRLFDHAFYSCEVGHEKTAEPFFECVADRLQAQPEELLFLDDSEPNVATARRAGWAAEHWHLSHGHDRLRGLLVRYGVL